MTAKIKTSREHFTFTPETSRRLKEMAEVEMRTKTNFMELIINKEYEERKKNNQL